MSLQDLGNLSQFIGGVAIVISLVYLAIQVRQNTRVQSSADYHQAAERICVVDSAAMQSADMAHCMVAGMRGDTLPAEEQFRFEMGCRMMFFAFEHLFRQHERGGLDPDTWNNALTNSRSLFTPTVVALWRTREGPLSRRCLAHLESRQLL